MVRLENIKRIVSRTRRRVRRGLARLGGSPRSQDERTIRIVETSEFFDADWYRSKYLDGAILIDAAQHYVSVGAASGFDPGPRFDTSFYLRTNPDVARSDLNPLVHYVLHGAAEDRRRSERGDSVFAEPTDSDLRRIRESGLFDEATYRARHPGVAMQDALRHYLRFGIEQGEPAGPDFDPKVYAAGFAPGWLQVNPLVHYVRHGRSERRIASMSPSVKDSLSRLFEEVSTLDSEFVLDRRLDDLRSLPQHDSADRSVLADAWRRIFSDLDRPYEHVVFVPWLVRGGADLVAAYAARALVESHPERGTLFVVADYDRIDARDWLPTGAKLLVLSDYAKELTGDERLRIIEALIVALRPRSIVNVNSWACWELIRTKGASIGAFSEVFVFFFCRDYDALGRPGGYSDSHFRDCLPHVTRAYFDNATFADELVAQYGVPASLRSKIVVLRQPTFAAAAARPTRVARTSTGRVFWAGRFCRQKNVELLVAIVAAMPETGFDVFGTGDDEHTRLLSNAAASYPNLRLHGAFPSFESLPTDDFDVYLYTSLWDGTPTVLINAAALRLPVVASAVGGIPELVDDETGWIVRDVESPAAYVSALRDALARPAEAERRAANLCERAETVHSWAHYYATLSHSPSFLD